jgi:hypothetical protein
LFQGVGSPSDVLNGKAMLYLTGPAPGDCRSDAEALSSLAARAGSGLSAHECEPFLQDLSAALLSLPAHGAERELAFQVLTALPAELAEAAQARGEILSAVKDLFLEHAREFMLLWRSVHLAEMGQLVDLAELGERLTQLGAAAEKYPLESEVQLIDSVENGTIGPGMEGPAQPSLCRISGPGFEFSELRVSLRIPVREEQPESPKERQWREGWETAHEVAEIEELCRRRAFKRGHSLAAELLDHIQTERRRHPHYHHFLAAAHRLLAETSEDPARAEGHAQTALEIALIFLEPHDYEVSGALLALWEIWRGQEHCRGEAKIALDLKYALHEIHRAGSVGPLGLFEEDYGPEAERRGFVRLAALYRSAEVHQAFPFISPGIFRICADHIEKHYVSGPLEAENIEA